MIKVLLVDDSRTMRRIWANALSVDAEIRIVGEAADPFAARDWILATDPDVVVLDIAMPRMDGLTFLGKLMRHYPLPVVVCSSYLPDSRLAAEALEAGAAGVVRKPQPTEGLATMARELLAAVRSAAQSGGSWGVQVVAIGGSAGATTALEEILRDLPARTPAMVVVQHFPEGVSGAFAARLDGLTALRVKEALDGESLQRGSVLIAPGGKHLTIARGLSGLIARVRPGARVCGHVPSVDVLFHSAASAAGATAVGVILSGMGSDGADGLLAMRRAGAFTLAQDEASSVVFGMPKAAFERGAACEVSPLSRMAERIEKAVRVARATELKESSCRT